MSRIEVPGAFVFENGTATFKFKEQAYSFNKITTMDQMRAVLVAIAQYGAQASVEEVLHGPAKESDTDRQSQDKSAPDVVLSNATDKVNEVLSKAEYSFQVHQQRTADALAQAEKDYETATAEALKAISS